MNNTLSLASEFIYKRGLKPLLFRMKPDAVHEHLLRSGGVIQKSRLIRKSLHGAWAYENPHVLAQKVCGIEFLNPVGLSAGFDKNFELPHLLRSVGFGFMEGGSLTYRQCDGNPRPWFYRLPKTQSLVVHAGLGNNGAAVSIPRLQAYPPDTFRNFPLNISVAKTNSPQAASESDAIDDYIQSLMLIKKAGVGSMVTINISCPNTYGGEPFTTPAKLERLLAAIDTVKLTQPVFIKMPIDLAWQNFNKLLTVCDSHQIAGVTIGNLAKDRSRLHLKDHLPAHIKGNFSGKPTWELSNTLIQKTYQTYGSRFVIIGVGGIFSAEDAYQKIRLGATLVELITGMIFEGPQLIGQINKGLCELLARDGYTHIREAIGTESL